MDRFSKICLLSIVVLLAAIALEQKFPAPPVYADAATAYTYEIYHSPITAASDAAAFAQEVDNFLVGEGKDGWQVVAEAPITINGTTQYVSYVLMKRK